jgi:hypothetical protein
MTWTLDYAKSSDFDDVSGHWHLQDAGPNKTRVFYACDIKLRGAVPGPILNYISKAALKQATSWVKAKSEANSNDTTWANKFKYASKAADAAAAPVLGKGFKPAFFRRGGASRPTLFKRVVERVQHRKH